MVQLVGLFLHSLVADTTDPDPSAYSSLRSPLVTVPHAPSPPLPPVSILHLSQKPFVTPPVREESPLLHGPLACTVAHGFTVAGADELL